MATIIDALVVTFGYDTKPATKGEKEVDASLKKIQQASHKLGQQIAVPFKEMSESVSKAKTELLGLLAAFGVTVGLKDFIFGTISGQAEMGRFSETVGVSTQRLDAWNTFARRAGSTAKDVQSALQHASTGIAQAVFGPSPFLQEALSNGINISGSSTPEQALLLIAQRMHEIADGHGARGRQLALTLGERLGVDTGLGQAILSESMPRMQADLAQLAAHSRATAASVAAAQRLQVQMADISQKFNVIGETIFIKIAPVLERLANKLANFLDSVDWNRVIAKVERWARDLKAVIDALGGIKGILIAIAAIKVLGWVGSIAGAILQISRLSGALLGLKVAGAEATAATSAGIAGITASIARLGGAVAVAAAAGGLIGHEIWKHLLEGTKAGDKVGSWVAHAMAALGNKQAQEAVAMMDHPDTAKGMSYYHPERTAVNKSKRDQAMAFFESQGWTKEQAAGIVANIQAESMYNPGAVGDRGRAYGLGQWHAGRQADFLKFAGHPIQGSSFEDQLRFYQYELTHKEKRAGNMLRNASTAGSAAMVVSSLFERPADKEGEMIARAKIASGIDKAYVGAQVAASGSQVHNNKTSTSTAETHIGSITVNTKATDADGIARGLKRSLDNHQLVAQADTGPE